MADATQKSEHHPSSYGALTSALAITGKSKYISQKRASINT